MKTERFSSDQEQGTGAARQSYSTQLWKPWLRPPREKNTKWHPESERKKWSCPCRWHDLIQRKHTSKVSEYKNVMQKPVAFLHTNEQSCQTLRKQSIHSNIKKNKVHRNKFNRRWKTWTLKIIKHADRNWGRKQRARHPLGGWRALLSRRHPRPGASRRANVGLPKARRMSAKEKNSPYGPYGISGDSSLGKHDQSRQGLTPPDFKTTTKLDNWTAWHWHKDSAGHRAQDTLGHLLSDRQGCGCQDHRGKDRRFNERIRQVSYLMPYTKLTQGEPKTCI